MSQKNNGNDETVHMFPQSENMGHANPHDVFNEQICPMKHLNCCGTMSKFPAYFGEKRMTICDNEITNLIILSLRSLAHKLELFNNRKEMKSSKAANTRKALGSKGPTLKSKFAIGSHKGNSPSKKNDTRNVAVYEGLQNGAMTIFF